MAGYSLTLQPEAAAPLYFQLAQAIRLEIAAGRWKPGEAIPSERELMRVAGISRATVRQAIAQLNRQGLIVSLHGRGTFVARPRMEQEIRSVYSFAEQFAAQGLTLEDEILQRQQVPATDELATLLALRPGDPLIYLKRLRRVHNVPLILDSSYFPLHLCPGLLTDPYEPPLYRLLAERYGLPPLHCVDYIDPVLADRPQAHLLDVEVGAPLLCLERVAFTRGDVPLHVTYNYVPGSRCRFRVHLWRESLGADTKGAGLPALPALDLSLKP